MFKRTPLTILIGTALALGVSIQAAAQNNNQPDNSGQHAGWKQSGQHQSNEQQKLEHNRHTRADAATGDHGNMSESKSHGEHDTFLAKQTASQLLASSIMGMSINNGSGDNKDGLGTITDLILNDHHQVVGIIVNIAGFLGVGEKNVGLSWDAVERIEPKKDTALVSISNTQLEKAPAYMTMKEQRQQRQRQQQRQPDQNQNQDEQQQ